ncbi:tetratricopeptide repeat protein [Candidatus Bipolaricaulota bacterium]|nr:tetratricopeptide repeat protein [Candidatus Bipolaricaulota bacterium]
MRRHCLVFIATILILGSALVIAAPTLDVGLLINGMGDVISYAGWPLLFEVSFANQGAFNDLLYNQEIEGELVELDELVASGDITEAEADQVRETLMLREIESVVFGAEGLPWTQLVSFESSSDELTWSIDILAEEIPSTITLGAVGAAVAWYGLNAECSADVAPGIYAVSVVVSTAGIVTVPEGMWTGTSSSAPVQVEIRAEPELTDELLVQKWIVFGRYELYKGAFEVAETYLLDAVALDPTSIEAWVLLGETQYALGKLEEALESFFQALDANASEPVATDQVDEPPFYLLIRITQIQDELGLTPKTAEEP